MENRSYGQIMMHAIPFPKHHSAFQIPPTDFHQTTRQCPDQLGPSIQALTFLFSVLGILEHRSSLRASRRGKALQPWRAIACQQLKDHSNSVQQVWNRPYPWKSRQLKSNNFDGQLHKSTPTSMRPKSLGTNMPSPVANCLLETCRVRY